MTQHRHTFAISRALALSGMLACTVAVPVLGFPQASLAQAAPATTSAATSAVGTVKSIAGPTLILSTDAGKSISITVGDTAKIVQLAPGSKDLKAAQPIALTDIAVGDRVLVTGKSGDTADTLAAARVILMKSSDIAQVHAGEQEAWRRNGMSGIATSVTPGTAGPTIAVSAGSRKMTVDTAATTIYRRYAGDSVKFEDARPGTADQIHTGDQLSVRGTKSPDGSTLTADEIVSGSFRNLSGLISSVDPATGTITLKDLATKQTVKIVVTANSDLRNLPPEAAARFAARAKGGTAPAGGAPAAARPADAPGSGAPGAQRSAGMDLSQMLGRLPTQKVTDLKSGQAVMVVANSGQSGTLTAVTLLSGVEPILSATPDGAAPMTLSPWSVGGGAPEPGGGGAQ